MKPILITACVLAASFCTGANAEETRAADAHQHGHGTLNAALDGGILVIELETPGADILGFEHTAESDADKAVITAVRATLEAPATLFGITGSAGCSLRDADIEIGADAGGHHGEHDDHHDDHDRDKHAHDEHDEDHHDEHVRDEHGHEGEEETHSEVRAAYTFDCTAPQKLAALDLSGFFAAFPNAEELDAALLSDRGQMGGEITPNAPVLPF